MRPIYVLCSILLASLSISASHAEASKAEAASQIIAEGKWTLAVTDAQGNDYWVDPYTLVQAAPGVIQINTLSPAVDPIWNRRQAAYVRARTLEFDCAARRYAHVGWRTSQGFKARSVIGGKAWNRYDVELGGDANNPKYVIEHFMARHVCSYPVGNQVVIDVVGIKRNGNNLEKVYLLNNKLFADERQSLIKAEILYGGSTANLYIKCKEFNGIIETANAAPQILEKFDPIFMDWVCKGLHPSTERISSAINLPVLKEATASSNVGGGYNPNASLETAKKKCAELGFKPGTEKFGGCVLKISK